MTKKTEYRGISKRARSLLGREEGHDVEFKQSLGQLDTQDIVAFANSGTGGAILIGVEEVRTGSGRQKGTIRGCPIGDREKQSIISRAESCVPPVDVEIFVENSRRTAFYRVEIPSGSAKPYCTAGGTYKIRGDARTKSLLPNRLLYMFVESEGHEFIERFRDATTQLEISLTDTRSRIVQEMKQLLNTIEGIGQEIGHHLGQVFDSAQNAEALSDDAQSLSDETLGGVDQILAKLEDLESYSFRDMHDNIDAILEHFGIEEPRAKAARVWVEEKTEKMYRQGLDEKQITETLTRQWQGGGIRAAHSEIWVWCQDKLKQLRKDTEGKDSQ